MQPVILMVELRYTLTYLHGRSKECHGVRSMQSWNIEMQWQETSRHGPNSFPPGHILTNVIAVNS